MREGVMCSLVVSLLAAMGTVAAAGDCPKAVVQGVEKAVPGASIVSCRQEEEDGQDEYSVVVDDASGHRLELALSPAGDLLAREEEIALAAVPAVVMDAFRAAHADAGDLSASSETMADGTTFYEIVSAGHETKLRGDGTIVEEEDEDDD